LDINDLEIFVGELVKKVEDNKVEILKLRKKVG